MCWGGVNTTTIQCVYEQSLEYAYFLYLFASNVSHMYKSLTKTKNTQSLEHMKHWKEWLQQMQYQNTLKVLL